jgi:hypothetical protein
MSIGSKLTQEHWFKGCIKELRFANAALSRDKLQTPTSP